MKWKYRAIKSDLGYNIEKKWEKEDWTMEYWFLWPNNKRILNKTYARTFYTEDDARWALVLMKIKDAKNAG